MNSVASLESDSIGSGVVGDPLDDELEFDDNEGNRVNSIHTFCRVNPIGFNAGNVYINPLENEVEIVNTKMRRKGARKDIWTLDHRYCSHVFILQLHSSFIEIYDVFSLDRVPRQINNDSVEKFNMLFFSSQDDAWCNTLSESAWNCYHPSAGS